MALGQSAHIGDARVAGAAARRTAPGTRACQSKTVQVRQWHSLSAQRRDTPQVASAAIGGRLLWGRELRALVIAPATLVRASESGAHLHRRCEKGSSSEGVLVTNQHTRQKDSGILRHLII